MDDRFGRKIAIVGLGALMPGAENVQSFWQNVLGKKVSIRPMTEEMFESHIYYDPTVLTKAHKNDKSYTRIAAWIDDLKFDTVRKYKIPPSVAEHMDSNQHAALYSTDQALQMNPLKNVENDRVGVIFGNGMVGISYGNALARIQFQLVEYYLREQGLFNKNLSPDEQNQVIEYVRKHALKDSIPITEDSAPGVLPNIMAGRIASVFDFHGPSFTVDAACASALAAVITGIQGLLLDEYDAVICGGADMPLKQLGFIYFSALNALSPDGSYPFDKRANGFVMGQGAGTVILKRLEDAVRDNDTIYAVITGFGQASDGKGKYIAAPNEEWQARAIEKACRMAGYPVDTIELIEAHGTATIVGDVVEVAALKRAFQTLNATRKNYCGLTSVKSNIGHLKSAAGIAGLIKAVLALQHKILPPTAGFEEINPKLMLDDSPFYVIDEAREWQASPNHPRRANVSAFGFGGADYHIALEEFRESDYPASSGRIIAGANLKADPLLNDKIGQPTAQVIFFSAPTIEVLDERVGSFIASHQQNSDSSFADQCFHANCSALSDERFRLALVVESVDDCASKYNFFVENRRSLNSDLFKSRGIFFKEGEPIHPHQIAVMFPGQASQYNGMFSSLRRRSESVKYWFGRADAFWQKNHGRTVTSLIDDAEEQGGETLRRTENAHPAIFTAGYAVYQLLKNSGLQAEWMIGHSLGELTALAAADKISFPAALELVALRGFAFRDENLSDPGKMISIMADAVKSEELLKEQGFDAVIANYNSPTQTIVAGSSATIDSLKTFLDGKGINSKILYVSHAFHSPLITPVAERFYHDAQQISFRSSPVHVLMNHLGEEFPNDEQNLTQAAALLRDQITHPVHFQRTIEKLFQVGVRVFVEAGPGSILSSQTREILGTKEAAVIAVNYKNSDDIISLQRAYAALFVEGIAVTPMMSSTAPNAGGAGSRVASDVTVDAKSAVQSITAKRQEKKEPQPVVVYSGAAIGLPGSYKNSFRDDNFEQVFAGRNFIERLTDDERQKMVELNIRKLIKDERGPSFKILSSLEEVIQLAGKIGKIDMIRDYAFDEADVEIMTSCIAQAVAAGYEALKDAHIPLVLEYITTASGTQLPQKWALPKEMQNDTGVIFANGFPMIDPVIEEVSRFVAYKFGGKMSRELVQFYSTLIEQIKNNEAKKLLTDWFALYYSRLTDNMGEEDVYQFNNNFMSRISVQANNRLANLINARGPNFQLNAACSSTSVAISVAEDFIRSGRAKRMLIIGADDSTSLTNMPWLGGGFLSSGAATNKGDLYEAAIPFDRRRNGMIMSAGAVGLVLETKEEVEKRGVVEICRLLGSHAFNTAKHPSQIDSDSFSEELEQFISRMEFEHQLDRNQLAGQTVYISHETYTPPRGGCSQTEAEALRSVFGKRFQDIIIGNTKGMTGHTMGASLEDAVAAKSLQYGQTPPVVNHQISDPLLEGLNLSRGGKHDREFALKMSAGFGAQGHFILLQKSCSGENRIINPLTFETWLKQISGQTHPVMATMGRMLVVQDKKLAPESKLSEITTRVDARIPSTLQKDATKIVAEEGPAKSLPLPSDILNIISQLSNYPPEILEDEMEMAADLGISAELQNTIIQQLESQFGAPNQNLNSAAHLTIGQIVNAFIPIPTPGMPSPSLEPQQSLGSEDSSKDAVQAETLRVFSEVTKYPLDMLDLNMEMEADLGIDTVKQATILSILGEKYHLRQEEGMQLSSYPTIGHIVDLVYEQGDMHRPIEQQIETKAATLLPEETVIEIEPESESGLARQIIVLSQEPLGEKNDDLTSKVVWVLGDNADIVERSSKFFQDHGAQVESLVFRADTNAGDIERELQRLRLIGRPEVIVDCSHIGDDLRFMELPRQQMEHYLLLSAQVRFIFYKNMTKNDSPVKIICLTAIDGRLGYDPELTQVNDPSFGALIGFYKGLRKEWSFANVRIIDFAPIEIRQNIDHCFMHVINELEHQAVGIEIAYVNNVRHVAKLDDQELTKESSFALTEKDTVLITGGGGGITAEALFGIAKAFPARFIVLDRIDLPENIASLAEREDRALDDLKNEIREKLQILHTKVTPNMINKEFEQITKAIDIYRNLQRIKKLGRTIHYIAGDICDGDDLKTRLAQVVEQTGPVTAVIHAAGLEKSHLLEQKSVDEFHQVFSVKALGAVNLSMLVPLDSLRLVVAFSSISGVFGNAAQLDYSAANSFLNFWVKSLRTAAPHVHAFSIAWSGWKDVGMAWRNEFVRLKSEEMGLHFIEIEEGVEALLQEIKHRSNYSDIIRHKGLGPFIEDGLTITELNRFPLLDRVRKNKHRIDRAFRVFSVKRDALIDQHRLGKVPILPAVAYSELAVEYYALQNGLKEHYLLSNVTFANAFKLFKEQPRELYVQGREVDGHAWAIEIQSRFRPVKSGEAQTVHHSSAQVSDRLTDLGELNASTWDYKEEQAIQLPPAESLLLMQNSGPEQRIILGPLYNDVVRESKFKEPVLIYPLGVTYPTYFPMEQLQNSRYPLGRLLTNPCFLDSIYQACAAYLLVVKKRVYLPWEVKELGIVRTPRTEGLYRSYAAVVSDQDEKIAFNVVMNDAEGNICYFAREAVFRRINL
ncbi:MAG: SDR family NAD(P)-dependent oxidoreductase [Calditrichaeota bacterium]|nr:MAG: SDR family NAD(P)-dependent oxidoreductase [Calditrichota bacterium]